MLRICFPFQWVTNIGFQIQININRNALITKKRKKTLILQMLSKRKENLRPKLIFVTNWNLLKKLILISKDKNAKIRKLKQRKTIFYSYLAKIMKNCILNYYIEFQDHWTTLIKSPLALWKYHFQMNIIKLHVFHCFFLLLWMMIILSTNFLFSILWKEF